MAYLALVRGGESEADVKGVFSGQEDFDLTSNGISQVHIAGEKLKNIPFEQAFRSDLPRGKHTFEELKKSAGFGEIPVTESPLIRERSYGIYSGQTYQQAITDMGQDEYKQCFSTWDKAIPGGESLKLVSERVIDFYTNNIRPVLQANKNVIVVLHRDPLRALIKYLEVLDEFQTVALDPKPAQVYFYELDTSARVTAKRII